jgi:hypothetical protein
MHFMKTQHIGHRTRKAGKPTRHKHRMRAPAGHRTHEDFRTQHWLHAFAQALRNDILVQPSQQGDPRL